MDGGARPAIEKEGLATRIVKLRSWTLDAYTSTVSPATPPSTTKRTSSSTFRTVVRNVDALAAEKNSHRSPDRMVLRSGGPPTTVTTAPEMVQAIGAQKPPS